MSAINQKLSFLETKLTLALTLEADIHAAVQCQPTNTVLLKGPLGSATDKEGLKTLSVCVRFAKNLISARTDSV
jgi:hypothetical protein